MKNVIVLRKKEDKSFVECWGALTNLCKSHEEIKYLTVRVKKFPFEYKGYIFDKVPLNSIK